MRSVDICDLDRSLSDWDKKSTGFPISVIDVTALALQLRAKVWRVNQSGEESGILLSGVNDGV